MKGIEKILNKNNDEEIVINLDSEIFLNTQTNETEENSLAQELAKKYGSDNSAFFINEKSNLIRKKSKLTYNNYLKVKRNKKIEELTKEKLNNCKKVLKEGQINKRSF
jgi:hypothetical protein